MNWEKFLFQLLTAAAYVGLGLVFFGLAFWAINKTVPFSLRKEIEEDQNMALAILIGSVILGISIVIAAAIHGS